MLAFGTQAEADIAQQDTLSVNSADTLEKIRQAGCRAPEVREFGVQTEIVSENLLRHAKIAALNFNAGSAIRFLTKLAKT